MSDTHPPENIPVIEQRFDTTEVGTAMIATLTEITPKQGKTFGTPDEIIASIGLDKFLTEISAYDVYESITNPGKYAIMVSWIGTTSVNDWVPIQSADIEILRNRRERVIRDYGMWDRREAPTYYPDAEGKSIIHTEIKY